MGRREGKFNRPEMSQYNLGALVWVQEHQQQQLGVEQVGSNHVKGCVGQGGHRAKAAETWCVSSL